MPALRLPLNALALTALCVTALWASPAQAKYAPTALIDMIGTSDLVVVATIDALPDKETMTLAFDEVLVGQTSATKLDVKRFQDWTCATRWTAYKPGQRAVFFLWKHPDTGKWRVRSGGNEGESPIIGDKAYLKGIPLDGLGSDTHTINGARFYGHEIDLTAFKDAIRDLRSQFAFKSTRDPWLRLKSVRAIGSQDDRKAYSARSKVHAALMDSALQATKW